MNKKDISNITEFMGENKNTAKRFVFVWPNYTEADILHLQNLPDDVLRFIVFGKETCPTTGTPHLQGYLEVFKDSGFAAIHKLIHCDWEGTGRFVDFKSRVGLWPLATSARLTFVIALKGNNHTPNISCKEPMARITG